MKETPNIMYGRLKESAHFGAYGLERALVSLKWMLEDERWKQIDGFNNIDDFIKSLDFSEFRIIAEKRKELAKYLIKEKDVRKASAAKLLGVDKSTIGTDIKKIESENQPVKKKAVEKVTNATKTLDKSAKSIIKSNTHVSNNSGENEWYTPSIFIEAARNAMGTIDCDPASSEIANKTVGAGVFYTKENSGLVNDWFGNVWLNPPYAQPLISEFADAVVDKRHQYNQACILVNNATETNWLQKIIKISSVICLVSKRIKFIDADGNASGAPLQGQVVIYIGDNPEFFINEFNNFGICLSVEI